MDRRLLILLIALVVAGVAIVVHLSRGSTAENLDSDRQAPAKAELSPPELLRAPREKEISVSDLPPSGGNQAQPSSAGSREVDLEPVLGDATLDGFVVDEAGRPVEGAVVHASSVLGDAPTIEGWALKGTRAYTTGRDGRFAVAGLASGRTLLYADGPGSAAEMSGTLEEVLVSAPARDVRLVLVRLGAARLRIVQPDGTPFVGTAAWVSNGSLQRRRVSGAQVETKDGTFSQYGLVDADYAFRVSVKGFAPIRKPFRARLGDVVDLGDVTLDPGVTLRGKVVDASGSPVLRASVIGDSLPMNLTNGQGEFVVEHAPRGPVDLTVLADGFLWHHVHLDGGAGEGDIAVTLLRGGVVHGILRDSASQPAGSAALRAVRLEAGGEPSKEEPISLEMQPSGYMYWHLPAGRWRIVWQRPATSGAATEDVSLADWTLSEGEKRKVDLTLPTR